MDAKDKGLLKLGGKSMVACVIDQISAQNSNILLNANRNLEQYQAFGYPVVEDELDDFQGPLAGILSAMQIVKTDYILTLPCDAPSISKAYQAKMWLAMESQQTDVIVAHDGQRMQSIHALIPVRLKNDLRRYLASGARRVDTWYSHYALGLLDLSAHSQMFANLNSPQDIKRYRL